MRGFMLLLLTGLLMTEGCAVAAVAAVTAAGVTNTILGTAEKTYNVEWDTVESAGQQARANVDIETGDTETTEDSEKVLATEIDAFSRDLTMRGSIERVTDKATRVVVDASRKYVVKDSDTEILIQTSTNLPKKS